MKKIILVSIFLAFIGSSPLLCAEKKEKKAAKEKIKELKLKEQRLSKEVFDATNKFRISKQLKALSYNSELATIAREHSKKMAHHKVPFSHADFDARIKKLSKPIKEAAENLFKATSRKEISLACVNSWRKSSGHRANLLGNYTDVGVGVYRSNDGFWYFTQIFASF